MVYDKEKVAKQLSRVGFNRWTKGGHDRMYYNIENTKHMDISRYNKGGISYAALDGEEISHASTNRLLGAKVYYDLNKRKMIGGGSLIDRGESDIKRKYADRAFKKATSGGGHHGGAGHSGG